MEITSDALNDYVGSVSIPVIMGMFGACDWKLIECNYRTGYLEFEYTGMPNDGSRIIFFRNWYDRNSWNSNEWKVVFKMSEVVGSLSFNEIELVHSLMSALKLSRKEGTEYDDLFESDHDKIEEQKEYIKYILGDS